MTASMGGPIAIVRGHLRSPALRTSFAIGLFDPLCVHEG